MKLNKNLAINGGKPVRSIPMPPRHLIGIEEKEMVLELINKSIETGDAFRYSEKYEREYENKFVDFMGGKGYADGVNSGTNALFSAIGSLDLKPQSEVIVPIMTDVGGATPVIYNRLIPIFCDVDYRSYNISADQIKPLLSDKTGAIIVAHISGESADILPIIELAKEKNIFVIEDCSQSPGASINGKKVGTFGDIAIFSTMSSKHHCTGGQGGVVYSQNKTLIEKSRQVADRGKLFIDHKYSNRNIKLGLNCNMDEISAAIGCAQIKKLPNIISSTNSIGEKIKKHLKLNSKIMQVGWQPDNSFSVYWFIRVKLDVEKISVSKKEFCKALSLEGIPLAEEYRYIPIEKECFNENEFKDYMKTNSENVSFSKNYINADTSIKDHFNIFIRESFDDQAIKDIIDSLNKVEEAFYVE